MSVRVLVIDGYEGFRRAMEYCLTKDGFEVAVAESARAAKDVVRGRQMDVVLLDATLSFGAGLEDCMVLKGCPELARTAVVLLAERAGPDQLEAARAAGAELVMPKVFDWHELLAGMERIVPAGGES